MGGVFFKFPYRARLLHALVDYREIASKRSGAKRSVNAGKTGRKKPKAGGLEERSEDSDSGSDLDDFIVDGKQERNLGHLMYIVRQRKRQRSMGEDVQDGVRTL